MTEYRTALPFNRREALVEFMRDPPQGSIIGENGPIPIDDPVFAPKHQFFWTAAALIEHTGLYNGLARPHDACLDDLNELARQNRVRKWGGGREGGTVRWQFGSWW